MNVPLNIRIKKKIRLPVIYIIIFIYLFFVLFPFYWIFVTSIKTEKEVIAAVPKFFNFNATPESYFNLFNIGSVQTKEASGGFLRRGVNFIPFLRNSLIVVPPAVLLSLILGIPAAYALARFQFRAKENLHFFYFSQYFLPPVLVLLPLYIIFKRIGLYNTYIGLILILQLVNIPLVILIMRSFFEEIPQSIEESALIEGCNWFQILTKITLPLSYPGIVAASFLTTIFSWNNFIFGLVLVGTQKMPVTVGMLNFQTYTKVQWNLMAAAAIVASIPPLILAMIFQKYLVRGLTLGAIK